MKKHSPAVNVVPVVHLETRDSSISRSRAEEQSNCSHVLDILTIGSFVLASKRGVTADNTEFIIFLYPIIISVAILLAYSILI